MPVSAIHRSRRFEHSDTGCVTNSYSHAVIVADTHAFGFAHTSTHEHADGYRDSYSAASARRAA
jgi:hypothetical protein